MAGILIGSTGAFELFLYILLYFLALRHEYLNTIGRDSGQVAQSILSFSQVFLMGEIEGIR